MKALVYETKVDSRAGLRCLIFAAAKHLCNHPDIIVSVTQSLLKCAEKCTATKGGTWNNYCQTGILVLESSIPKYATSVLMDIRVPCKVLGNLRMTS
jgi:hypothetical protein